MINSFTILKHSRKFSETERKLLLDYIRDYTLKSKEDWLHPEDYADIDFYWCDIMTPDSGVLGAKVIFNSNIYLASNENTETWIQLIAPTAIHELRHNWQKRKYGKILYGIMCILEYIPGLYNKIPIEVDAWRITEEAEKILSSLR